MGEKKSLGDYVKFMEETEPYIPPTKEDLKELEVMKLGRDIKRVKVGDTSIKKTLNLLPFEWKGKRFWLVPLILHLEAKRKTEWDSYNLMYRSVLVWEIVRIEKWNIFKYNK